jgi:hypothetical protein
MPLGAPVKSPDHCPQEGSVPRQPESVPPRPANGSSNGICSEPNRFPTPHGTTRQEPNGSPLISVPIVVVSAGEEIRGQEVEDLWLLGRKPVTGVGKNAQLGAGKFPIQTTGDLRGEVLNSIAVDEQDRGRDPLNLLRIRKIFGMSMAKQSDEVAMTIRQ